MKQRDAWAVLGLRKGDSREKIQGAYRRLAMKYHPDRNPGDKSAEARFREITEAYRLLIEQTGREGAPATPLGTEEDAAWGLGPIRIRFGVRQRPLSKDEDEDEEG